MKLWYTLGTIQTWYKKPGDLIKKDDVLCDIETKVSTSYAFAGNLIVMCDVPNYPVF